MRHLFCHSVYQDLDLFGEDPRATLMGIRSDGIEMLTSFDAPPAGYPDLTTTVHLPYASDWLAAWEDRPHDMPADTSLYVMYGRSRREVVSNIRRCIEAAAPMSPGHGVMHACNADLAEVKKRTCTRDSESVIRAFCEMMNEVASGFPEGEPPFKIVFENLWWPGMRLVDGSDFDLVDELISFDNWGICLDTGHLMNCLPGIYTEQDGIEAVTRIVSGYSRRLRDSISAVHFHFSASGQYRETFQEEELHGDPSEFYWSAYRHVSTLDQHRAYSDPSCVRIIDILSPDYVIHELPGKESGPFHDFVQQRSLFQ